MSSSSSRASGVPVRVLVVDSDRRVRQSLCGLAAITDDLVVVDAVADADAAIRTLEQQPVDVVLIDPRLPDVDVGLALLVELHARWSHLAMVVMSSSDDVAHPALSNGALAFVAKAGQPETLMESLRRSGRAAQLRAETVGRAHDTDNGDGSAAVSLEHDARQRA
jgi:two-component system response regulator AtoC